MPLLPNGLFLADVLSVLERMESERVTLAYLDPPLPADVVDRLLPAPAERHPVP